MKYIKGFLQKVKRLFCIIIYNYYVKKYELDDKLVLFLSDSRDHISGNFEFIYNYLKENNPEYELKTHLKKSLKSKRGFKEKIRLVRDIAKAKYILVDDFYPLIYPLKIRKNAKLIQVWHAMGAFKTVGYSRNKSKDGYNNTSLTHKNYTDTIVSSENIRGNYAEAFGIDIEKVHPYGVPRTDIFFSEEYKKNIRSTLYKKYPQFKNKKVILFAPTFRGQGQKSAYYDYSLIDFDLIKKNFSKDYVFLVKMHPFIKEMPDIDFENDDFYFDLSSEREINDLLFITDILITDYSSVIFEYSFFNKPVIFYTPDYKDYDGSRGFYYPFSKYTYGDVAKNNKELINSIKKGKVDKKKLKEFFDYFCGACDGKSTERVVKKLITGEKDDNTN